MVGAGNDIEIPTFSINIEIQKDISIDIEISIYDPVTSVYTKNPLTTIHLLAPPNNHTIKGIHITSQIQ